MPAAVPATPRRAWPAIFGVAAAVLLYAAVYGIARHRHALVRWNCTLDPDTGHTLRGWNLIVPGGWIDAHAISTPHGGSDPAGLALWYVCWPLHQLESRLRNLAEWRDCRNECLPGLSWTP